MRHPTGQVFVKGEVRNFPQDLCDGLFDEAASVVTSEANAAGRDDTKGHDLPDGAV